VTRPPWAETKITSVNLTRAALTRRDVMSRHLGISGSRLVDVLLRAFTDEEMEAAYRRQQTQEGIDYEAWARGRQ